MCDRHSLFVCPTKWTPGALAGALRMLYLTLPTQAEFELISQSLDPPLSVEEYKAKMATTSGYADALVLLTFARTFQIGISVIGPSSSYKFLGNGGEQQGVVDGTHWVAYRPQEHYYGILRDATSTGPRFHKAPAHLLIPHLLY